MGLANDIILAASNRASAYSALAGEATAAIGSAGRNVFINPYPLNVDKLGFDAVLERPDKDTTPLPVYDAPAVSIPSNPTLVELHGITMPDIDSPPTITTTGLFGQVMPSSVIPDWNEAAPDLHTDEIYNELAALAAPILSDVELPSITPINVGVAPELLLPSYEVPATPEAIGATTDYASYLEAKYAAALPEMQAFIDDKVAAWVTRYAPELEEQRSQLHTAIMRGLNDGALPDQFEAALYSRAQGRTNKEFTDAENAIIADGESLGFIFAPGKVVGAIQDARLAGANALSAQATDIYIERRKSEVQHMQFVLGLVAQQVNSVRTNAIQLAANVLDVMRQANTHADTITAKLLARFEHERSRHEFSLEIMKVLNSQYEVRLKAAMAGLEGYKLELEALGMRSDVEMKQVEAAKLKVQTQQLLVARYSEMVDAIAKRAIVDELKIKEYGIRADVFKTDIQARLAAFDAYKAAIDGDKAKLQGELAKLEAYNSQLKAKEIFVDVQAKILDGDVKTNAARLGQFTGQLDAYKTASQVALQRFMAQSEIKKMGLEIYKTDLQANIAAYEGELKLDTAWAQTQIEVFKANTQSWMSAMQLEEKYTELNVQKAIAIATSYSNIASASAQSANGTASVAATE
jgi:hypothetical protein